MIVRLADPERDALAIMDGARDFVARMEFTDAIPESDEGLIEAVARIVTLDGVEIAVAEHMERIVGGMGMFYTPYIWNPHILSGIELFWWTAIGSPHTTALALLRFVQKRMTERGVRLKEFGVLNSSPEGVTRIYAKMGLRKVQEQWAGVA